MNFSSLLQILLLVSFPIIGSGTRVQCDIVLECDLETSCYSLKGGFPFVYGKQKDDSRGKKYSMFLARNVETLRCVLLDAEQYELETLRHPRMSIPRHKTNNEINQYRCEFCNQVFTKSCAFRSHVATHGNIHYGCSKCHYRSKKKGWVLKHIKEGHRKRGRVISYNFKLTDEVLESLGATNVDGTGTSNVSNTTGSGAPGASTSDDLGTPGDSTTDGPGTSAASSSDRTGTSVVEASTALNVVTSNTNSVAHASSASSLPRAHNIFSNYGTRGTIKKRKLEDHAAQSPTNGSASSSVPPLPVSKSTMSRTTPASKVAVLAQSSTSTPIVSVGTPSNRSVTHPVNVSIHVTRSSTAASSQKVAAPAALKVSPKDQNSEIAASSVKNVASTDLKIASKYRKVETSTSSVQMAVPTTSKMVGKEQKAAQTVANGTALTPTVTVGTPSKAAVAQTVNTPIHVTRSSTSRADTPPPRKTFTLSPSPKRTPGFASKTATPTPQDVALHISTRSGSTILPTRVKATSRSVVSNRAMQSSKPVLRSASFTSRLISISGKYGEPTSNTTTPRSSSQAANPSSSSKANATRPGASTATKESTPTAKKVSQSPTVSTPTAVKSIKSNKEDAKRVEVNVSSPAEPTVEEPEEEPEEEPKRKPEEEPEEEEDLKMYSTPKMAPADSKVVSTVPSTEKMTSALSTPKRNGVASDTSKTAIDASKIASNAQTGGTTTYLAQKVGLTTSNVASENQHVGRATSMAHQVAPTSLKISSTAPEVLSKKQIIETAPSSAQKLDSPTPKAESEVKQIETAASSVGKVAVPTDLKVAPMDQKNEIDSVQTVISTVPNVEYEDLKIGKPTSSAQMVAPFTLKVASNDHDVGTSTSSAQRNAPTSPKAASAAPEVASEKQIIETAASLAQKVDSATPKTEIKDKKIETAALSVQKASPPIPNVARDNLDVTTATSLVQQVASTSAKFASTAPKVVAKKKLIETAASAAQKVVLNGPKIALTDTKIETTTSSAQKVDSSTPKSEIKDEKAVSSVQMASSPIPKVTPDDQDVGAATSLAQQVAPASPEVALFFPEVVSKKHMDETVTSSAQEVDFPTLKDEIKDKKVEAAASSVQKVSPPISKVASNDQKGVVSSAHKVASNVLKCEAATSLSQKTATKVASTAKVTILDQKMETASSSAQKGSAPIVTEVATPSVPTVALIGQKAETAAVRNLVATISKITAKVEKVGTATSSTGKAASVRRVTFNDQYVGPTLPSGKPAPTILKKASKRKHAESSVQQVVDPIVRKDISKKKKTASPSANKITETTLAVDTTPTSVQKVAEAAPKIPATAQPVFPITIYTDMPVLTTLPAEKSTIPDVQESTPHVLTASRIVKKAARRKPSSASTVAEKTLSDDEALMLFDDAPTLDGPFEKTEEPPPKRQKVTIPVPTSPFSPRKTLSTTHQPGRRYTLRTAMIESRRAMLAAPESDSNSESGSNESSKPPTSGAPERQSFPILESPTSSEPPPQLYPEPEQQLSPVPKLPTSSDLDLQKSSYSDAPTFPETAPRLSPEPERESSPVLEPQQYLNLEPPGSPEPVPQLSPRPDPPNSPEPEPLNLEVLAPQNRDRSRAPEQPVQLQAVYQTQCALSPATLDRFPYTCHLCPSRFANHTRASFHIMSHRKSDHLAPKEVKKLWEKRQLSNKTYKLESKNFRKWINCPFLSCPPEKRNITMHPMGKKYDPNGEDTKNQAMYTGANGSLPGSSSGFIGPLVQPPVKWLARKDLMVGPMINYGQKMIYEKKIHFLCSQCPYVNSDISSLQRHFRHHMHEFRRTWSCTQCSYSSYHFADVYKHVKLHMDIPESETEFKRWVHYENKMDNAYRKMSLVKNRTVEPAVPMSTPSTRQLRGRSMEVEPSTRVLRTRKSTTSSAPPAKRRATDSSKKEASESNTRPNTRQSARAKQAPSQPPSDGPRTRSRRSASAKQESYESIKDVNPEAEVGDNHPTETNNVSDNRVEDDHQAQSSSTTDQPNLSSFGPRFYVRGSAQEECQVDEMMRTFFKWREGKPFKPKKKPDPDSMTPLQRLQRGYNVGLGLFGNKDFGLNRPRKDWDKELDCEISRQCIDCGYRNQNIIEFRKHRDGHYENPMICKLKCDECNFRASYMERIVHHNIETHHLRDVRLLESLPEFEPEEVEGPIRTTQKRRRKRRW
ncbi:hypothetical protein L3Y34_011834 [Caenorhabditis briggsae]|uniref:C2H2-type domain-containing protein n=2 Tax=Caenorhabditis briggsae TaxID=6238 RepID=A0AAE8ZTW3_CAEBR|nr:hypothetical protein L3Y34_011834 [Caenorhabditis briggsae]